MQKRRFPMVPIVAITLKVVVTLAFLATLYLTYKEFAETIGSWAGRVTPYGSSPAITSFGARLESLFGPLYNFIQRFISLLLFWGIAELIQSLREIEFNTRLAVTEKLPATETPAFSIEPSPTKPADEG